MKNYNKINPEIYDKRYVTLPPEIYFKEHYSGFFEKNFKKYCTGARVLDLGCGYGRCIGDIKKYAREVVGIDTSDRWLNYARKKHSDVRFILGDACHTPFEDCSFDVIINIGLLEFVDRVLLMGEIKRILNGSGICIICAPNKYSLARLPGKYILRKKDCDEPSRREMLNLFKKNNFLMLEEKFDDGLVWLPKFISKICGKKIYYFVEKTFKLFGENNPLSNVMCFVIQKNG